MKMFKVNDIWLFIVLPAVIGVSCVVIWYLIKRLSVSKTIDNAKKLAEKIVHDAKKEAKTGLKEAILESKEHVIAAKAEFEAQTKETRKELSKLEKKLTHREDNIERKVSFLENLDQELSGRERQLKRNEDKLEESHRKLEEMIKEQQNQLEKISSLTTGEAKRLLMKSMEQEARNEVANLIRKIEDEAKENGLNRARKIVSLSIQRCASDHVVESTVSAVDLPNEEMKGRIIGREGRNIRALETATGIDLIIDDTPEAVILSGFDPLRREVARITIERLITNGRIHPARIEEMVGRVKEEIETKVAEEGETTAQDLGIHDLHKELFKYIGKLKYRTSFGQNVLQHSKEVASIAAIMASELGANTKVAKRAGLLHDIGKAIDREYEGTHTSIGVDLAKKYGESEAVIHAIEAHHFDVEPMTIEAILVQAADTLSAARPGARREILETYIKRLEKLEEIADSFQGVAKAYAIQAGREIRIIVENEKVSDEEATWLCKDIAKRIEQELEYPGEIRVTVIREMRAIEFAR